MSFTRDQFELLAPGGDLDSIKAAIAAGADAVYCGLDRFNARNRATNITFDVLQGVIDLAHQHKCKIFLTLNIVVLENEIPSIIRLLNRLAQTDVDGVIVQDLGLAYIIKRYFPTLDIHASTQMNTHNEGQVLLLSKLGASRVNLSRELNIDEIAHLAEFGHKNSVLMEVFVHGSYCIGFSGLCYFSSEMNGASGNRGRCSQPCRDKYQTTTAGMNYPLNLKDNSAYENMAALAAAGVHSLKIEGRIKKSHYVYTVVDKWRQQIDHFCHTGQTLTDKEELYTVFNRNFSNGYLQGNIHRGMYIDNPRNYAAAHFAQSYPQSHTLESAKRFIYDRNTEIINKVNAITESMPVSVTANRSLKGGGKVIDIPMPKSEHNADLSCDVRLSVLISSQDDLDLMQRFDDVDFLFQIPDALALVYDEVLEVFARFPGLVPYFPPVLIGEHFQAATRLLEQTQLPYLVTNNLGVAQIAQQLGVNWVAGPQLNITNSFALKCLQKSLDATGAFISNELNAKQMKRLVKPDSFRLFYSIYHPISLMTSRQCLIAQSVGCKKQRINNGCMKRCEKTASIISLKDHSHVIHKARGSYNCLYANQNFLNLNVLKDVPALYTDVMVDLRNIPTDTKVSVSKVELIDHFRQYVNQPEGVCSDLSSFMVGTTNQQYIRGLS